MHVLPSPFNLCPCRLQEQKGEDPAEPRPVPKEVGLLPVRRQKRFDHIGNRPYDGSQGSR